MKFEIFSFQLKKSIVVKVESFATYIKGINGHYTLEEIKNIEKISKSTYRAMPYKNDERFDEERQKSFYIMKIDNQEGCQEIDNLLEEWKRYEEENSSFSSCQTGIRSDGTWCGHYCNINDNCNNCCWYVGNTPNFYYSYDEYGRRTDGWCVGHRGEK